MSDEALIEAMADEIAWAIGEPLHSRSPGIMLAAQRALAALRKTHAVVPREPTPAMLIAAGRYADFCATHNYGGSPDADGVWTAMLTASEATDA